MFFNTVASKHCPVKDPNTLKWQYTLPDFLRLQEYVEIMNALDTASYKDLDLKNK